MTKLTSRWPPVPLPYARGQTAEPGLADLMSVDAACLMTLHGHTVGGEMLGNSSDTPNPAPINPAGEYGHDHSGGWFGKALFRTIATTTFDDGATFNSAEIAGGVHYGAIDVANAAGSENNFGTLPRRFFAFVPPCDPVDGAYRELGIHITARLIVTALDASDSLIIQAWRSSEGSFDPILDKADFTLSAPNTTGEKTAASGATTTLRVIPGAVNYFGLRVRVERVAGGASRGCRIELQEIELGVYET